MRNLTIDVHGMTCGACTAGVRRALGYLDGVSRVVTLRPGSATEVCGSGRVTPNTIASTIAGLGLKPAARPRARHERPAP